MRPGLLSTLPPVCCLGLMLSHFFSFSITFLVSFLVGVPMLIGRGVSAKWYVWGCSGAGRIQSLEKCSVHLLSCSWTALRGLRCLSLTGLSVCWYLLVNFLVMSYMSVMFLYAAASFACIARLSMWPLLSALIHLFTSRCFCHKFGFSG